MAEFASKGLANGVGIPALAMSSVALLNQLGNGNGLLGGLIGGNTGPMTANLYRELAEKDNKISELTSQRYSDSQIVNLYQATRSENQKLRDDIFAYVTPLAQEAAENKTNIAVIQGTIAKNQELAAKDKEITELHQKLLKKDVEQLGGVVFNQGRILNQITKTIVPKDAICPEFMNRYNSWTAPTAGT